MSFIEEFSNENNAKDVKENQTINNNDFQRRNQIKREIVKKSYDIICLESDSSSDKDSINNVKKNNVNTKVDIIDGYAIECIQPEDIDLKEDNEIKLQIKELENRSMKELDFIMRSLYDELLFNDPFSRLINNYFYKLRIYKLNRSFNLEKSIIVSGCGNLNNELEIEKLFSTVGIIEQIYINLNCSLEETFKTWLKHDSYSQLISNINLYKNKYMVNNYKYINSLKENEIFIEYVDSVSCEIALEAFKFLKIKGKNITIRHAYPKPICDVFLKVEGLNKNYINDNNLHMIFYKYSEKIKNFTFGKISSHFYITVRNSKIAKSLLKYYNNKKIKFTDDILKVEIVPEIYLKTDIEAWNKNEFIGCLEKEDTNYLNRKRKNKEDLNEVFKDRINEKEVTVQVLRRRNKNI